MDKKALAKTVSQRLGYTSQAVSVALSRPLVQKTIARRMAAQGITEKKVYGAIYDALEADKPLYHPIIQEFIDKPDHPTRLQAAKLAAQLRGDLTPDTAASGDKPTRINIIFGDVITNEHSDGPSSRLQDIPMEQENTTV